VPSHGHAQVRPTHQLRRVTRARRAGLQRLFRHADHDDAESGRGRRPAGRLRFPLDARQRQRAGRLLESGRSQLGRREAVLGNVVRLRLSPLDLRHPDDHRRPLLRAAAAPDCPAGLDRRRGSAVPVPVVEQRKRQSARAPKAVDADPQRSGASQRHSPHRRRPYRRLAVGAQSLRGDEAAALLLRVRPGPKPQAEHRGRDGDPRCVAVLEDDDRRGRAVRQLRRLGAARQDQARRTPDLHAD
jgi:hypothetical protein